MADWNYFIRVYKMLNKADFNRISVNLFLLSLLSFGIEAPLSAAPLKNVSTNDSQIVFLTMAV